MRIPRWAVWPALCVLAVFLIPSVPHRFTGETGDASKATGAAADARATPVIAPSPAHKRVVVLGIDGLDPDILNEAIAKFPDRMKSFSKLIAQGGLHELGTSTPPQSPVAWSCFITGRDPGGHGIFDFIHRDPTTRAPIPSTTKTSDESHIDLWGDWEFPLGGDAETNRSGRAFWQILAEHGVAADIWRMTANFPVEPARGLSFSGMMTPAIDSAYGEYKLYTSELLARDAAEGGKTIPVREYDGVIDTYVKGPPNTFKVGAGHVHALLHRHRTTAAPEHVTLDMHIFVDHDANAAVIQVGDAKVVLAPGQWSDFVRLRFGMLPTGISSVGGIVRFYLRSLKPDFEMYASPVNIDPMDPIAPVSAPKSASKELANAIGLYYTQGMPEDVNALKDKALTDVEFMEQSALVHDEGVRMMDHALDRYLAKPEGGFLFFYFSGIDLCSHMMWRHFDTAHPNHDARFASRDSASWSHRAGSTWKDVIYDLYAEMDPVVGRLLERLPADALLVVMSDHGFAPYHRKFSLNTWLVDNGYLVLKPGFAKELARSDPAFAPVFAYGGEGINCAVDWTKTRAYGVGFNGLYLNLARRELHHKTTSEHESGIVHAGAEGVSYDENAASDAVGGSLLERVAADALLAELNTKREAIRDDGQRVVLRADLARDVYHGARVGEAPDILVGYDVGYGNSDQAALGRIPHAVLEDNLGGTFNGNHLMAPEVVKGSLMTNGVVLPGAHGLEDLTIEILKQYGIAPDAEMRGGPVLR
jgi:predicted AlkP superfamily phosphohydrolase/phosphomutase